MGGKGKGKKTVRKVIALIEKGASVTDAVEGFGNFDPAAFFRALEEYPDLAEQFRQARSIGDRIVKERARSIRVDLLTKKEKNEKPTADVIRTANTVLDKEAKSSSDSPAVIGLAEISEAMAGSERNLTDESDD